MSEQMLADQNWVADQADAPHVVAKQPGVCAVLRDSETADTLVVATADRVPYITKWSGEKARPVRVVRTGAGIAYADELQWDRDERGVLWTRTAWRPGRGRPEFGQVHAARQRRAMTRLLCQVCGGPADRTSSGVLWLLGEDPAAPGSWPDPLLTVHPPVCAQCAARAVRACPHLRGHYAVLRVRASEAAGVRGPLYQPGWPRPVVAGAGFGDPRNAWVKAGQFITRLHEFSVTDMESL
jgi:ferredoxin